MISLIRNIKNNKIICLSIVIVVICIVYFTIDKMLDNYNFSKNKDIVFATDDEDDQDEGNRDKRNNSDLMSEADLVTEEKDDNIEAENPSGDTDGTESDASSEINGEGETEGKGGKGTSGTTGESSNTYNNSSSNEDISDSLDKIYIYIIGEVKSPGVVILKEGSRIVDAINAAGGITDKANISKVNLVYVLEDGMKVNIPNDEDLKNNANFEYITMGSGDGRSDASLSGSGLSGQDRYGSSGNSSSSNSNLSGGYGTFNIGIVNINTATQTELETLPGIGPSTALKIIKYRDENGLFSSIEEIKNVSGIGDAKFESIKDFIKV